MSEINATTVVPQAPVFIVPELEAEDSLNDRIRRDIKDIKAGLKITESDNQIAVFVLAVHGDHKSNNVKRIVARKGVAIGGYAYDTLSESYLVSCVDYISLGYVRVAYDIEIAGAGNWSARIPLPEVVLKRYMNAQQKADLKKIKMNYIGCRFEFLQMVRHD